MASRILVVEDDASTRYFLKQVLEKAGFSARSVENAEQCLEALRNSSFDLILLDLMLPGLSGMKVCELLKQNPATARVPIIILTAAAGQDSKVQGLDTGADDYIVKPPAAPELVARVNALLRRVKTAGVPDKVLRSGTLSMDLEKKEVTLDGKPVELRKKEFELLRLLLEKTDRAVSRSSLFKSLWKGELVSEHTLEVHVNHLRSKLGRYAACLRTLPGTGYKFQAPAD